MNLLESIKQGPFSLARFLPKSLFLGPFFWVFISFVFSLLTVGVSFLHPCVFTPYLPFLAILGLSVCLTYRMKGLLGCLIALSLTYLISSPSIERETKVWQLLVLSALFLDFLIVLLARFEADAYLEENSKELHKAKSALQDQSSTFDQKEKEWIAKFQECKGTILNLKEEVRLGEAEKKQILRNMELIQSEIEMLNLQKEEFISDTHLAKRRLEEVREISKESVLAVQEKILSIQKSVSPEKIAPLLKEIATLQEKIATLEEEASSLRKKLSSTQEESREKAASSQEEMVQLREKMSIAQKEASSLRDRASESQGEILTLREKMASTQEEIASLQEKLSLSEKEMLSLKTEPREKAPVKDDLRVRILEGQISQLRQQFDEKAKILTQTRKTLFQKETEVEGTGREKNEALFDRESERERILQKEMANLLQAQEELEKEITFLEELVSHILHR